MKRVLIVGVLGLAGLVAATSLTLGALAVVGDETPRVLLPRLGVDRGGPSLAPSASDTKSPDPDRPGGDGSTRWSPSSASSSDGASGGPSGDDSGSSGSGSDDSGSHSSDSGSDDSGSDEPEHDDD